MVHRSTSDTIVAQATPLGRSGIAVIRLSGPQALKLIRYLIGDSTWQPEPRHTYLKYLQNPANSQLIDKALICFYAAPHSFTGEDVIEISCHGSPVLISNIIDALLISDARIADPGEFTLRALSHGKLDLSQAEAIRDLINAQTNAAAKQALRQLSGELSARIEPMRVALVEIIVPLESSLEFVEDDLPTASAELISEKLQNLLSKLEKLADTFRSGKLLKDGLKVTLAGQPNVGKSSVFNRLLEDERAIVTSIPGTTRDSLGEPVSINGIPVLLTDTAGLQTLMI
ncbi:MAG: tRNA uridine-5-carboxymethylaminomethyl(34) synthesis GTPase MnmE [Pyrinomonadaceae bacterium]